MKHWPTLSVTMFLATGAVLLPVSAAHAYLGPGAGLSAIGSVLAIAAAVVVAVIGFLWYPLKRLMRGRQRQEAPKQHKGGE